MVPHCIVRFNLLFSVLYIIYLYSIHRFISQIVFVKFFLNNVNFFGFNNPEFPREPKYLLQYSFLLLFLKLFVKHFVCLFKAVAYLCNFFTVIIFRLVNNRGFQFHGANYFLYNTNLIAFSPFSIF